MAEIGIEEKKRGAPWVIILLLVIAAVIIGWWLWSNRSNGDPVTGATGGAPDTAAVATPVPVP